MHNLNSDQAEGTQTITKSLYLINQITGEKIHIPSQKLYISNQQDALDICHLFQILKLQNLSQIIQESVLYVFDPSSNMHIYINPSSSYIPMKDIRNIPSIKLYYQKIKNEDSIDAQQQMSVENSFEENQQVIQDTFQNLKQNKHKRQKERQIGFLYEQVEKWLNIHKNGYEINGKVVKVNLEQAANVIGMSRKTLDDYRCQVQSGKQNGFDFQKHWIDKVGVLRRFNKQIKKENNSQHERVFHVDNENQIQIDDDAGQIQTIQTEQVDENYFIKNVSLENDQASNTINYEEQNFEKYIEDYQEIFEFENHQIQHENSLILHDSLINHSIEAEQAEKFSKYLEDYEEIYFDNELIMPQQEQNNGPLDFLNKQDSSFQFGKPDVFNNSLVMEDETCHYDARLFD